MSSNLIGVVKFFDASQRYGFIYHRDLGDIHFSSMSFADARCGYKGRLVSFRVEFDDRGKPFAIKVEPRSENQSALPMMQAPKQLDGFPIIAGSSIKGFTVAQDFGAITSDSWWYGRQASVAQAKEFLQSKAVRYGANAVFDFVYHRSTVASPKNSIRAAKHWFWAEGRAVKLASQGINFSSTFK